MTHALPALFLLGLAPSARAAPDIDARVYRIRSNGCPHAQSVVQTGFLFELVGQKGLITTLHGVVGCTSHEARNATTGVHMDLKVSMYNLEHDLAFLTSEELQRSPQTPLPSADSPSTGEQPGGWLSVIGYPQGVLDQWQSPIESLPLTPLRNMFAGQDETYRRIAARNSPHPDSLVLRARGAIQPGLSGAPLIHVGEFTATLPEIKTRRVVAIAEGALAGGATDMGWSIPFWKDAPSQSPTWQSVTDPARFRRLGERLHEAGVLFAYPSASAFYGILYSRRVQWSTSLAYARTRLNPHLPRDLVIHSTNPGDPFLPATDPGTTDLQTIEIDSLEVETGPRIRLGFDNLAFLVRYVFREPFSHSGREEKQQQNDYRPPSEGSFIYTKLVDVRPSHMARIGVAAAFNVFGRDKRWLELEGVLDIGRMGMTFEKGWTRFGQDQTEWRSSATGTVLATRLKAALSARSWSVFTSAGLPSRVILDHEHPNIETHTARGYDVSFGGTFSF